MRRFWNQISEKPEFYRETLNDNFQPGERIFVGSSIDMFANEIPTEWIREVVEFCAGIPKTAFLFQTKNPVRFNEVDLRDNFMIGTTIESDTWFKAHMGKAEPPEARAIEFGKIKHPHKMISIEPIMAMDPGKLAAWIIQIRPVFVSIGADSKGSNLPEPAPADIRILLKTLEEAGIETRIKENLHSRGFPEKGKEENE